MSLKVIKQHEEKLKVNPWAILVQQGYHTDMDMDMDMDMDVNEEKESRPKTECQKEQKFEFEEEEEEEKEEEGDFGFDLGVIGNKNQKYTKQNPGLSDKTVDFPTAAEIENFGALAVENSQDSNRSVAADSNASSAPNEEKPEINIAIRRRKTFKRYLKMKKLGVPTDAIKNAMIKDGLDPGILDRNENDVVPKTIFEKELRLSVYDVICEIGGIALNKMKKSFLLGFLDQAAEEEEEREEEARLREARKLRTISNTASEVIAGTMIGKVERGAKAIIESEKTKKKLTEMGLKVDVMNLIDSGVESSDDNSINKMMSALHRGNLIEDRFVDVTVAAVVAVETIKDQTKGSAISLPRLLSDYAGAGSASASLVASTNVSIVNDNNSEMIIDKEEVSDKNEEKKENAVEFVKTVETRHIWQKLRSNIREAAREYYRDQLLEEPRNVDMIVRMGFLCIDSSSNPNLGTTRASSVLLQKAANYGYDGDGLFWESLATQHLKSYKLAGLRSERLHLVKARAAWDIALNHLEVATKSKNHISYAETSLYLGNTDRALKAYESIMKNFPNAKEMGTVRMKAAGLKFLRNEYKESIEVSRRETSQVGIK